MCNAADPGGRAAQGVGLRLLTCWDCGFETSREHGCLPVVAVACCQIVVSARVDHSSKGALPIVVCLSVIVKPL